MKHLLKAHRFLTRPKHIEVQILGDADGNVVHLFERDCTLQRKHQKIIEISPAWSLDPIMKDKILKSALTLAARIKYGMPQDLHTKRLI